MRKSNLLLMATLLIFLISLGMYNVALKAEHRKGSYKDPYQDYKAIAIKDFQSIDINAASRIKIQVMQGAFRVLVHKNYTELVKVKKTGNRLQVDAAFSDRQPFYEGVVIFCPRIADIKANAAYHYIRQHETVTETMMPLEDVAAINVSGFTLDSLLLKLDHATLLKLHNNKIGKLRSITGISPGAVSYLEINSDNTIREANLTVKHAGKLSVFGNNIARLRYHFGDSTQISISGAALSLLKK